MALDEEAVLRAAVNIANVPTLLMVLVQMTGDLRWIEDPYCPTRTKGLEDNDSGGLADEVQLEIRSAAADAILALLAGKQLALPSPSLELLVRMMSVSMGEPVPSEYGPMIAYDLGLTEEARAVEGDREPLRSVPPGFSVLVIGAGVSGIAAATRLGSAGIDYTILEKHRRVGGTWLENRYPGCGVDTPNHLYSFSFAKNDWAHYYALRDELEAYLERVASESGILANIRFGTEVVGASYDEDSQSWNVEVRIDGGGTETLRANVVISAVGAFRRPKTPDIKGLETFQGPVVHTARWDEGLDLVGKNVAVIGNGASAMQLVPAVADDVCSLTVFQRSPQWAAPFEKHKARVPDSLRLLLQRVPLYHSWYRARLGWTFNDKVHPSLQVDPAWPHPERSVNAINDAHREFFTRHIASELGNRQDLLPKVLPTYPPFGKRMLLDNGWFRALTRDNVHLVTDPISAVTTDRIVTASGSQYRADVIVLATGFDVVRFLAPMDVRGRSGRTLRETWDDDDARAYLGLAVPDFPNFFCLYGPNAQAGHGGSLILIVEIQMHYVMTLIQQMFEQGIGSVECRKDVHDRYNERVDRAHASMVWTHPGMDTYYRNSRGRVVVNNPFRIVDFWRMTRRANLEEYITEPALASGRSRSRLSS